VTDDDKVVMASEAGVLPIPDDKIVRKMAPAAGKMLLIDLEQGRIVEDEELKRSLAEAEPYEEWLKQTTVQARGDVGYARRAGAGARPTIRPPCSIASRPSATPRRTSSSSSSR